MIAMVVCNNFYHHHPASQKKLVVDDVSKKLLNPSFHLQECCCLGPVQKIVSPPPQKIIILIVVMRTMLWNVEFSIIWWQQNGRLTWIIDWLIDWLISFSPMKTACDDPNVLSKRLCMHNTSSYSTRLLAYNQPITRIARKSCHDR
jgi:hypothetical protein